MNRAIIQAPETPTTRGKELNIILNNIKPLIYYNCNFIIIKKTTEPISTPPFYIVMCKKVFFNANYDKDKPPNEHNSLTETTERGKTKTEDNSI